MTILSAVRGIAIAAFAALTPSLALACACGCGVFDVGDGAFMPATTGAGLTAWFRYSYMDQSQNWEGASPDAGSRPGHPRTPNGGWPR